MFGSKVPCPYEISRIRKTAYMRTSKWAYFKIKVDETRCFMCGSKRKVSSTSTRKSYWASNMWTCYLLYLSSYPSDTIAPQALFRARVAHQDAPPPSPYTTPPPPPPQGSPPPSSHGTGLVPLAKAGSLLLRYQSSVWETSLIMPFVIAWTLCACSPECDFVQFVFLQHTESQVEFCDNLTGTFSRRTQCVLVDFLEKNSLNFFSFQWNSVPHCLLWQNCWYLSFLQGQGLFRLNPVVTWNGTLPVTSPQCCGSGMFIPDPVKLLDSREY